MSADTITIKDVWSYISNKIASKVNDPFDELNGVIIPVNKDGSFGEPLKSDEFDDVYEWIAHLCRVCKDANSPFETPSFGFMIPGYKKDPETMERMGKIITFALVKSYDDMKFGVWDLDTNDVHYMPDSATEEAMKSGPLPAALGALTVGIDIVSGGMGEAGSLMREAMKMIERGNELAYKALAMLQEESND